MCIEQIALERRQGERRAEPDSIWYTHGFIVVETPKSPAEAVPLQPLTRYPRVHVDRETAELGQSPDEPSRITAQPSAADRPGAAEPTRERPAAICSRCSEPILAGTGLDPVHPPVHFRCVARSTPLDSPERQYEAGREPARPRAVTQLARELIDRRRQWLCPVCSRPLQGSGEVLLHGERLVHAACWSNARGQ